MPDLIGLARLMKRSRLVAQAMLRLAGLDDVSLRVEEARLRQELLQLQAKRAEARDGKTGPPLGDPAGEIVDPPGPLDRARDALTEFALRRAEKALADARKWTGE